MRIFELEQNQHTAKFEAAWSNVKKHCKDALHATKATKMFLYHGASIRASIDNNILILPPRERRKPMNMPLEVQDMIDDWFTDHGFAAKRDNSTFLTTKEAVAKYYTDESLYICFPVDGFELTWSPVIEDLYGALDKLYDYWRPATDYKFSHEQRVMYMKQLQVYIDKFMDQADWHKGDLAKAMQSHSELMIANKPIYCFRDFFRPNIQAKLETTLDRPNTQPI